MKSASLQVLQECEPHCQPDHKLPDWVTAGFEVRAGPFRQTAETFLQAFQRS